MFTSIPTSIQFNNLSEGNKNSEQNNIITNKSKTLNQYNNDLKNISIKPNNDIPKTIYYKRLCEKLIQQNETVQLQNKKPKEIKKCSKIIIDDNMILHNKNEKCNSNNNTIKEKKEMATPLILNESEENLNSTLVICESDVTPNGHELDTISVIQCEHPKKGKENISSDMLFSNLKKSTNLKKKMIITPTTISVQNVLNETMKYTEDFNKSINLNSNNIKCKISNSLDNQLMNNDNKNIQSTFVKEHNTKNYSELDNKPLLTTDIICNQKSSTRNNNQISTKNIEVEQVPIRSKIVEIKNNIPALTKKRKSYITCLNSSNDHKSNMPIKNVKCLSINKEKLSTSLSEEMNNQLEHKLSTINNVDFKNCIQSDDFVQNSTNEKSFVVNTCTPIPSISIEVEQIPARRKTVILKSICDIIPTRIRKSRVTCLSSSNDYKSNMSIKNIKSLSMNNEKPSTCLSEEMNDQLEHKLPTINNINNFKNVTQSDDSVQNSSKNKSLEKNLVDKSDMPSISIEVEQGLVFKRSNARKVIIHSSSKIKQEKNRGRRVQLITIKDHYSQPLPSFNGAKKTEIDVSKKSVHIGKVVESSSHFYVPQVKRRKTINLSNADL